MRGPADLEEVLDKESLEAAQLQQKLLEMTETIMEKRVSVEHQLEIGV